MLNSFLPVSFVVGAIGPIHLPISVAQIFEIVSFVDITTSPAKYSIPALLVVDILPFVLI